MTGLRGGRGAASAATRERGYETASGHAPASARGLPTMNERFSQLTAAAGSPRLPAVTSLVSALLAATCCLLPLGLIAIGAASAGLMMTTMRYEWLTLPLGVVGLGGSFAVYVRNRRGCDAAGCRVVGQGLNQAVLALATVVVTVALLLRLFPSWTAWLLQQL